VDVSWWAGTTRPGEWGEVGKPPAATAAPEDARAAWSIFAALQAVHPGSTNSGERSQWYGSSFARDDRSLAVLYSGVGRARGSIMAVIRQSWWDAVGVAALGVVAGLTAGWHTSRLDLAADARTDDRLTPGTLYEMLPAARSRSRPAHRVLTLDWNGGQKLTVGSRASARYLRCYCKGDDRVRHELELKQGAAGSAWERLVAGARPLDVWASEYERLVRWQL
jgi:hypothetical protein